MSDTTRQNAYRSGQFAGDALEILKWSFLLLPCLLLLFQIEQLVEDRFGWDHCCIRPTLSSMLAGGSGDNDVRGRKRKFSVRGLTATSFASRFHSTP